MVEPAPTRTRSRAVLRFFIAHGLSYPITTAWAFASIPALVIGIASHFGTTLDDQVLAHKVLLGVAWPSGAAFLAVHVAGVLWGMARDDARARRRFAIAMAALTVVPLVLGGASWIYLMTR